MRRPWGVSAVQAPFSGRAGRAAGSAGSGAGSAAAEAIASPRGPCRGGGVVVAWRRSPADDLAAGGAGLPALPVVVPPPGAAASAVGGSGHPAGRTCRAFLAAPGRQPEGTAAGPAAAACPAAGPGGDAAAAGPANAAAAAGPRAQQGQGPAPRLWAAAGSCWAGPISRAFSKPWSERSLASSRARPMGWNRAAHS